MIKFLDVHKQDKKFLNSFIRDIKKLFKKNDFILGNKVKEFEKKFSNLCNSKYAIGCANGTDALTLALKSLDLPKNSEVIMPAMTYCSTAFAIINAGLKPILVDIESKTPTIDINEIKKKITSKTKVIMPVHLYGSVANINQIKKLIGKKKIHLIDDASQAHGAIDDSNNMKLKNVGSSCEISCFSLYPGKNLGAYGDAGIITTNNKSIFKKIENLRNLGSTKKFIHSNVGFNSRLDTIQAIFLIKKLTQLKKNNKKRISIANFYSKNINNNNISKILYSKFAVYHQYVIMVKNRKKLINIFEKNNIQYGFHYPKSINQLEVFKKRYKKQKFKNAEKLAKYGISLPIDPNLKINDQKKIVNLINSI
tara:strand:+ start:638 stop:1735 length:1098 start_codon:yes stop_codon:yes gene_type:complete